MLPQPSFFANQLSLVPDAEFNLRQFNDLMARHAPVTIAPVIPHDGNAVYSGEFDCFVCEDAREYRVFCPDNGHDWIPCVACAEREVA